MPILQDNTALVDKNLRSLIQEISNEIDDLGLEIFDLHRSLNFDEFKAINRPIDLAPLIEHTSLRPDTKKNKIIKICDEAKLYGFHGVCVNPIFVRKAAEELEDSKCSVISVVGFPLGSNLTTTKEEEANQVIENGADEIDVVMTISALKDRDFEFVFRDIQSVVRAARTKPVKVIIETGLLEKNEKIAACMLALRAGASFIKTSTGFAYIKTQKGYENRGATLEDVRLIKSIVGNKMGIKASGGVTNFEKAKALVEAGATRLGCSKSVSVVTLSQHDN
jgi:deoxyribose-phosphate aldolase